MAFKYKKFTTSDETKGYKKKASSFAKDVENYGDFEASDILNGIYQNKVDAENIVNNWKDFEASDALNKVYGKKTSAEDAVANYGDFAYSKQGSYDDIINQILNRKDFTYDLNGDALYQQYKDQYNTLGLMASQNTMGQAAALTGGYGSSYAQSVGQQAYQSYLQQLNDKVPELYQLAMDKYNMEGNEMYNKYSMLSSDRDSEYGQWSDGYNRLVADRDYYGTDYYKLYDKEYGEWSDAYDRAIKNRDYYGNDYYNRYGQEFDEYKFGYDQLVDNRDYYTGLYTDGRTYDRTVYDNDRTLSYDQYRDDIADKQWDKSFAYQKERDLIADQQWAEEQKKKVSSGSGGDGGSGGSGGDGGGGGDPKPTTISNKNTTSFIANHMTKNEFMARGKSYKEYLAYIDAELDKAYGSSLSDETKAGELAYLLNYYGL